ncbi:phage tail protein (plasmid) [Staphylococcus aureus]|nr:phage tail protein [Staphylococcus aureus]UXV48982.1 phage tail protein [Staphylococcus aureus]
MEYTHPLADVFGVREAEPIINQNITREETMRRYLESEINSSFKTSISLDFLVLRKAFPNAIANVGDVIPIHSKQLAINEKAKIVEVKTKRDINNKILKQDVLLGDTKRAERYQKKVNQAANFASGLGGGNTAVKTIRTITGRMSNTSAVTNDVAKSAQSVSYSEKGIKTSNEKGSVTFGEGRITSIIGENEKEIINGDGIVANALPLANENSKGVISPQEKAKLNQIEYDSIILTGNDKKKYSLTVVDGRLAVKELAN